MSTFRGINNHMPAGYRINRRFTANDVTSFTEIDIRSSSWAPNADLVKALGKETEAAASAVIKQVIVTVDSGTVEVADSASPGDQVYQAGTGFGAKLLYNNTLERTKFWLQTVAGAATYEVEVLFDITD